MIFWMTLCGDIADKFPSHRWLEPIHLPLDIRTVHQPMRVYLDEEYPNYGGKPCAPNLRTESRLRVRTEVGAIDKATCTRRLEVFAEPDRYSMAKKPALLCRIEIGGWLLHANWFEMERLVTDQLRRVTA